MNQKAKDLRLINQVFLLTVVLSVAFFLAFGCTKARNEVNGVSPGMRVEGVQALRPFFDQAAECKDYATSEACDADSQCTWCKSAAIPSKCYNLELSKKLPPGVFNCDKKGVLEITRDSTNEGLENKRICDPNVAQIVGYFRLGSQKKHYFFWFFESRNNVETDPVVLWMTGGPGCSSGIALFRENGPCSIEEGLHTKLNPYSWNSNASIIFIDQPAGTGFSYGDYDTNEEEVGNDMDLFLRRFFEAYPQYNENPFFIFGESYAGHYVPATGYRVFKNNKKSENQVKVNLKGIGIGNGLTDPEIQYQWYADMAYDSNTAPSRVSKDVYDQMKKDTPECIKKIRACNGESSERSQVYAFGDDQTICRDAAEYCEGHLFEPYAQSGYNQYDMRIKCQVPGLCYDFSEVTDYLNSEKVQDYLGIPPWVRRKGWHSCDDMVNYKMLGDWMKNYQQLVPEMLEDKESPVRVFVYAGDVDFSVNYLGCRAWVKELEWSGKEGYNSAKEEEWYAGDCSCCSESKGKLKSYGGLSFLQVYQAGHMVPMDKPKEALAMLNEFIFA